MRLTRVFLSVFVCLLAAKVCFAYVPEPQTEGKFFPSKGTMASEEYEAKAGMPVYEYGKGIQWGPVHFKPELNYSYR